jgi:hypothetical protein
VEDLPDIVRVVLTQASRMRRLGAISELVFNAQVDRLEREELKPRGYHLLVQDLPGGATKFSIEATATGQVRQLLDGNVALLSRS